MRDLCSKEARRRLTGWILAGAFLLIGFSPASRQLKNLPDSIDLTEGYETRLSFSAPIQAELHEDTVGVLSGIDQSLQDMGSVVTLSGGAQGDAELVLKLLGVPVKTVSVSVRPEKIVMPGGQSIGVAIRTQGVLVVGASDIGSTPSPARLAGLRSGDRIEKVDGVEITSAKHLTQLLSTGRQVELDVARGDDVLCVQLTPVKDERDGIYRLGAWVRDSTAGVGTLSFYDGDTAYFGALGHAITDIDTGTQLHIGDGGIYESIVVGVMKGTSGKPGELVGEFAEHAKRIGDVEINSDFGIYGECDEALINELYPGGLPIATRSEVICGPAQILTTLDDGGIQRFDCEIEKLYRQDEPRQRSMVVKITDERLLDATGGIVQGMSGSPIIQDGRLVGAVTHVFVNDPTHGYGVYIEWMLDQCA